MSKLTKAVAELISEKLEHFPIKALKKGDGYSEPGWRVQHPISKEFWRDYVFQTYENPAGGQVEVLDVISETFAGDELMRLWVTRLDAPEKIAHAILATELMFLTKVMCGGDVTASALQASMSWMTEEYELERLWQLIKVLVVSHGDNETSAFSKCLIGVALEKARNSFTSESFSLQREFSGGFMSGASEVALYWRISRDLETARPAEFEVLKAMAIGKPVWDASLGEVVSHLKKVFPANDYLLVPGVLGPTGVICRRAGLGARLYDFSGGLLSVQAPTVQEIDSEERFVVEVTRSDSLMTKITTVLSNEYLFLHSVMRPQNEANRVLLDAMRANDRLFNLQTLEKYEQFFMSVVAGEYALDHASLREARGALKAALTLERLFHEATEKNFYTSTLLLLQTPP